MSGRYKFQRNYRLDTFLNVFIKAVQILILRLRNSNVIMTDNLSHIIYIENTHLICAPHVYIILMPGKRNL